MHGTLRFLKRAYIRDAVAFSDSGKILMDSSLEAYS
jgi:hypothetical protein